MALKPGQKPTTGTTSSRPVKKSNRPDSGTQEIFKPFTVMTPSGEKVELLRAQRVMIMGPTGKIRWEWRPWEK